MSEQEEALAREILADAQRRADRARKRAEREARAVLDEARREVEEAVGLAVAQANERCAHAEVVSRARVQQEVARLRLEQQKGILDRVRAGAEEALRALTGTDSYRAMLVELAVRAIEAMTGERFELALRLEDRQTWGDTLPAEVQRAVHERLGRTVQVVLADETLGASGGLTVRGADGRQEAAQSFEARMERLWEQARTPVARIVGILPEEQR